MTAHLNLPFAKSSYRKVVYDHEDFLIKNLPTYEIIEKMYTNHLLQEIFFLSITNVEPSAVVIEKNKEIINLIYDKNVGEFFQFYEILVNLNDKTCGSLLKVKLIDLYHGQYQNNHLKDLDYGPSVEILHKQSSSTSSFKCFAKVPEVIIPSFSSTTITYSKTRVYMTSGNYSGLELQFAANPSSEIRNIKAEVVPVIPSTPASLSAASLGIRLSANAKLDSHLKEMINIRFQLPDYYCINKENRMLKRSLVIVGQKSSKKGNNEFIDSHQECRLNRHDDGLVSTQVQATSFGVVCCFWKIPQFILDAARLGPKFYYPYFMYVVDCLVAIQPWNSSYDIQGFNLLIILTSRQLDVTAKLKDYQTVGNLNKIDLCCGKFKLQVTGNIIPNQHVFWLESLEKIVYFTGGYTCTKIACAFETNEVSHLEGKMTISYLGLPDNLDDADPRRNRSLFCERMQADIVVELKSDQIEVSPMPVISQTSIISTLSSEISATESIASTQSSKIEIGMLKRELETYHANCLLIESLIENIANLQQLHTILSSNGIGDDSIDVLEAGKDRLLLYTKQETVEKIYHPILNSLEQRIKMQKESFAKLASCQDMLEEIINALPPQIAEYVAAYFPNYSRGLPYLRKQVNSSDSSTIFVTGDNQAGKSTLINFLLGKDILTSSNLKSYHSYQFRYSTEISVEIIINKSSIKNREVLRRRSLGDSLSTFLTEQTSKNSDKKEKKIFKIFYPSALLKAGITIIEDDTEFTGIHDETAMLMTGAAVIIYVIDSDKRTGAQIDKVAKFLRIVRDKTPDTLGFPAGSILFACNKWEGVELDERPHVSHRITQEIKDIWPQFDDWQIAWTSFKNGLQHFKGGFVASDMKNLLQTIQKQLSSCFWFRFVTHIRYLERFLRMIQIPYKFYLKNCTLPSNQLRNHLKTIKQAQVKILAHLQTANEKVNQILEEFYRGWSSELTESLQKMIDSVEFESEMSRWNPKCTILYRNTNDTTAILKKLLKDRIMHLLIKWENVSCIFKDMEFETERIITQHYEFPPLSRDRSNRLLPLIGPLFLNGKFNLIFPKIAEQSLKDKDGLSIAKLASKPRINCEYVDALLTSLIDTIRFPPINSVFTQSLMSKFPWFAEYNGQMLTTISLNNDGVGGKKRFAMRKSRLEKKTQFSNPTYNHKEAGAKNDLIPGEWIPIV
ncbi:uncharacterized protein TRIADDRAFT_54917 [Trichoplax adhaerens]|uniref:G domain-containing protein n=1 Tax=Trichoplax adhaerens TaxID=10228 RepID=B3RTC8_TRIAD|nr:predicted protein [Trichoplax adhaerens]EDV26672.1 predicted protein [Trichoplax adhaerens]|eukprot:XP_002110668.1 predicted protein [Trichoplax adhaerens]